MKRILLTAVVMSLVLAAPAHARWSLSRASVADGSDRKGPGPSKDKPDKNKGEQGKKNDEVHTVPEPASLTLLAVGAGSVFVARLRNRRRRAQ